MNGFGQNITNITEQIMTDNFKSETTYTGYVEALNEKQQRQIRNGREQKDTINNTKDMNPMIMLSGEDGSASHSNISTVNLTSLTTIGGSN